MDIREIRLKRLEELLREHDNNKAALARTLKKAPAQVSQWFNGVRTITEESARAIEREAKKPYGWLDFIEAQPGMTILPPVDEILRALPSIERHEALEFVRFKIERARPLLAKEEVARYMESLDRLEGDGDGH